MTRQKEQEDLAERNRKEGRKGESNDNLEIPDREVPSNIPGLPSVGFDRLEKQSSYREKPDENKSGLGWTELSVVSTCRDFKSHQVFSSYF